MLGTITSIEEVGDVNISSVAALAKVEYGENLHMDGYRVTTDRYTFHVLIDNGQNCCESWGYLSSDDDLQRYVGAELTEIRLTDTALNTRVVEDSDYYKDAGGIQFVDFATTHGTLQLVVYNAHNGYYGHDILIAKDDEVILNATL